MGYLFIPIGPPIAFGVCCVGKLNSRPWTKVKWGLS